MSDYVYLSEGITGKSTQNKTAIPITKSTIQERSKVTNTKSRGWFSYLFSREPSKTKPIFYSEKSPQQLYYEKYGIIYTGSDLGSCINSIL